MWLAKVEAEAWTTFPDDSPWPPHMPHIAPLRNASATRATPAKISAAWKIIEVRGLRFARYGDVDRPCKDPLWGALDGDRCMLATNRHSGPPVKSGGADRRYLFVLGAAGGEGAVDGEAGAAGWLAEEPTVVPGESLPAVLVPFQGAHISKTMITAAATSAAITIP